jgi:hypothetical protein
MVYFGKPVCRISGRSLVGRADLHRRPDNDHYLLHNDFNLHTLTTVTSTSTSITTTVLSVAIVGTVSVDKVITQFDIWSQATLVLATLGSGAVGWFLGTFAQSNREGGLLVYENRVSCRKHGMLVTVTPAGLYCPIHRKVIA